MSTRHRTRFVIEKVRLTLVLVAAPCVVFSLTRTTQASIFAHGSVTVLGAIGQVGHIDVHQASVAVYMNGTGQVCVGRPAAPNTAPSSYTPRKSRMENVPHADRRSQPAAQSVTAAER